MLFVGERRVIKLETISKSSAMDMNGISIKRVAVYARVSTTEEKQLTSMEAQKDYYTKMIDRRKNWTLVEVYADEGITGTSQAKRPAFKKMIKDCETGKIDMIITKSLSRFARNTLDTLVTLRNLKSIDVGVYFEKEKIWTLDSSGEFMLTLLSSLAQEEARSISENSTWGQRKRFADGKVSVAYSHFLGYDKGPNGELVINPKEAIAIRRIYKMFLQGLSMNGIAAAMGRAGILTPYGKEKWRIGAVRGILINEKYKGDALLQKQYTVDFLTRRVKRNEGELPQYYITNNHEPIIEPWLFDYVQEIIAKRRKQTWRYSGVRFFSSKIICEKCGAIYGPRPWHSTIYNHVVWQCRNRYRNNNIKCRNTNVYEVVLHYAYRAAWRHLLEQRREVHDTCMDIFRELRLEKLGKINDFLQRFMTMHLVDIAKDEDDLSLIIKEILVKKDKTMTFQFIDGSEYVFDLPNNWIRKLPVYC